MTIRIFVAEDQPLVRMGLASVVDCEPDMAICGEAAECSKAWREVRRLRPHVVIVELSLQAESTIGLIRRINELDGTVNVVVYSRHNEQVYAIPSFKAGARAFVMKSDEPDTVIDAIRKVHRGELRFSDEVGTQILSRITSVRGDRPRPMTSSLSPRELEVVTLIAGGLTSREIAKELHVSVKTVEAHRAHIKQKANIDNATALVRFSMHVASEDPLLPA